MRDPEQFDAFYKGARERLLVQTFALTGDLAASRRAVRDAFIVAWHHWRKNVRLEDPEAALRPRAWRLAQRHHTARVWHRDKDIGPEVREILDGLGKLSAAQRRALVLTQLASVSMPQMAREIGLPLEAAERELQTGSAQLAMSLDIATPALRQAFETISASVIDTVRWPRATIVRRAGSTRRRTHTTIGAVGAVAAVLVSGAVVTSTTGLRPTLDRTPAAVVKAAPSEAAITDAPVEVLPASAMLPAADLKQSYGARSWTVTATDDNEADNGLVVPCRLERFADPQGRAALVRQFSASKAPKETRLAATQIVEASGKPQQARRTFSTVSDWFAGCAEDRLQLLSTATPEKVGDEGLLLVLRSWARPVETYVVGIARTGVYTTTTFVRTAGDAAPDRAAAGRLLAASVNHLCTLEDGGACAGKKADLVLRDPLPVGSAPALLSELDLPPVGRVNRPWVGTEPRKAVTNDASSACDNTSFLGKFRGSRFSRNATRTFVIPEADLPQEFGLTETVASLPAARAQALVAQVRNRLAGCSERDLNTSVKRIEQRDKGSTSLSAWRLDIDVTDNRTVTFWMAILRDGTSVGQLGFLPATKADMEPGAFLALAQRSLDRLGRLPGPRASS